MYKYLLVVRIGVLGLVYNVRRLD